MCPMVSSATAAAFFPGQFATYTPRFEQVPRSIVFTPAPARMTNANAPPASTCAASTFVERTMTISGSTAMMRALRLSPSAFASTVTMAPRS